LLAHLPLLFLLTQQQHLRKTQLKNVTAFLLLAKTTVQPAQAQHVQVRLKLITKATLGLWFQLAHVKQWNCQQQLMA
jgi:hypothetical protein